MAMRRDSAPQPPSWIHGFLARQMRRYREMAGRTQVDVSSVLHISFKHYSAMELGTRIPSRDVMEVMDDTLDARGALVAIREEMVRSPHPEWFQKLRELEVQATGIWQFEVQVVPGLLQTEGYARAVLEAAPRRRLTRTVEEDLAIRIERQALLTAPEGPEFWFVLDESTLDRRPADRTVMAGQLERLLEVAQFPNVTLQVLPLARGFHAMLDGPATILKFDHGSDDVVYVEPIGQGLISYDPATITYVTRRCDLLRAEASPPAESMALIRSKLESL
ncbi:helix-turn-helix domain-containing protein [Yinghuangia soli]|uniref:Helix-turn-helix transcriptional regulator n=1 Tax=Yinghuangia soli TaxID=2908204 RepID=A0AA41U2P8_9ACTN|nr:helix-turn-helix transcriptional regulator [Yinghuangia soli]MCF2527324.1 helix-turn-helix transcriptional regulator [Yinghuangia soli]